MDARQAADLNLKGKAASGVDGLTGGRYANGRRDRLADWPVRVHSGADRALPSRRVYRPKANGSKRPLGIAAREDQLVQKARMDLMLAPIYESELLGFNCGFRPPRSAPNALDTWSVGLIRRRINGIVDADIRGFLEAVHRDGFIRLRERRMGDQRGIRLIIQGLHAGGMEAGPWSDTGTGTPQGAMGSPVWANIESHYGRDRWTKGWRWTRAAGDVIIVR